MDRKRVLLIIPELSLGGASRSMAKLSILLAGRHDISIVVFNKLTDVSYPIGGELITLDVIPGNSILDKATAFLKRIRRLKTIYIAVIAQSYIKQSLPCFSRFPQARQLPIS